MPLVSRSPPLSHWTLLTSSLFNTWFSIGWLGMTWLYPAEVTPLRIRAPANALYVCIFLACMYLDADIKRSTASNWIWNLCVPCTFDVRRHSLTIQLRSNGHRTHVCKHRIGYVRSAEPMQSPY